MCVHPFTNDYEVNGINTLFRRRRRRPCFMMMAVIVLLALSTIAIPLGVALRVAQPHAPHDPLCPMHYPHLSAKEMRCSLALAIIYRLGVRLWPHTNIFARRGPLTSKYQHLISDIVVVYRSWALWPDSRVAKGVLLACITGSTGKQNIPSAKPQRPRQC